MHSDFKALLFKKKQIKIPSNSSTVRKKRTTKLSEGKKVFTCRKEKEKLGDTFYLFAQKIQ